MPEVTITMTGELRQWLRETTQRAINPGAQEFFDTDQLESIVLAEAIRISRPQFDGNGNLVADLEGLDLALLGKQAERTAAALAGPETGLKQMLSREDGSVDWDQMEQARHEQRVRDIEQYGHIQH